METFKMLKKNRKLKRNYRNNYLIILFISLFLFPIIFGAEEFNSDLLNYELSPKLSNISQEDFIPVLSEEKYSLGNITVNDIDFSNLEIGLFLENETYPLLKQDYDSGAYKISRTNFKFMETMDPAIQDNLNEKIVDSNIITVKLNETLEVEYNNPQAGYLVYHSRLKPSRLYQFFVNNGTDTIELEEPDFTFDGDDYIVFYYKNYFQKGPVFNFTMNLIWEYDLNINSWSINQYPDQDLIISKVEQTITTKFNYSFNLFGRKYGETIQQNNLPVDNIDIALTMNLPDKNQLDNHSLSLNGISVDIGNHLNQNNSVEILLSDHFLANDSVVLLNFTSQFTIKFINPVEKTWAIDRLVSMRNMREKIYIPSLIDGPRHIYLKDLTFYENSIFIDQVISSSSQFERNFEFSYLNSTLTGKEGIEIKLPYLIPGETCPCIIKYTADQTLRIFITDNIRMPLVGARIEVFYYGIEYGTYISNNNTQPVPPGKSNENGEISLDHVLYGNYTIRVYYNGVLLKESTASTLKSINYVYTNYPHFPFWILIFSLINVVIILIGVIFYLKNKRIR
jgi:hypothetical protein